MAATFCIGANMGLHEINNKYLGFSLVAIAAFAFSIWTYYYPRPSNNDQPHPPIPVPSGSTGSTGTTGTSGVNGDKGLKMDRPKPPNPEPHLQSADNPVYGYSFPNMDGIYAVGLIGAPDDLDDSALHSLLKYNLHLQQEVGHPTSVVTFRVKMDPNQQSDQCPSTNGISVTIDLKQEPPGRRGIGLKESGSGFACFGSDRRTSELEALSRAFTDMKID